MQPCKSNGEGDLSALDADVELDLSQDHKESYGQILKSTTLIGGSTFLNVLIGIVRTKAMAMLLGPTGFGLMSLYSSIFDLARSVGGLGVNCSGVRQIAEAIGAEDKEKIGVTVVVLRRISIVLGMFGGLLLLAFCVPISWITFGDKGHAAAVAALSIAVFLRVVSDGQGALLQGMRRIGDMAKCSVLATLCSTLVAIPLIYFFREEGVAFVLVMFALVSLFFTSWYSRRVQVSLPTLRGREVRNEARELVNLGIVFMSSSLMVLGVSYVVRIMILRTTNFDTAGFYQAAWTLGGLYVGFILEAMGTDFYPRLTGAINDHKECNRLVNEQALISVLLAGPGIIGTLTFSPLVISVFYGSAFRDAVPILRWICLGMTLRVMIWPIGHILMAKGAKALFFWTELVWVAVHLVMAWILLRVWGGAGAGMAFFCAYVIHGLVTNIIVRRLTGFRWSEENCKAFAIFLPSIGVVFLCCDYLAPAAATVVGIVVLLLCGHYSLRVMSRLIVCDKLPAIVQRILMITRLMPRS